MKDYYAILELKRDCHQEDIANSYKKLSLRWHSKLTQQHAETARHHFSEISEAYQVLSDPLKRAFYDKYGWERLKQGLFADGQLQGGYRFGNNPDEIFQKFFADNHVFNQVLDKEIQQRGSMFSHAFGALHFKDVLKPVDLEVFMECTLNELYQGVAKRIHYSRRVLSADGRTTELKNETRLVEIKPGYNAGSQLRFAGEGHQTVHKLNSDLVCKIKQLPHAVYTRHGDDLVFNTSITLPQALDCKSAEILTLDGRSLKVPIDSIITPQTLEQVKSQGMPIKGTDKRGDLYIKFNIEFPKLLSEPVKLKVASLLA